MKNIVLIGMPGCGKTTISQVLAKKIPYELIDLDDYLTDYFKMSIPEMFRLGEPFFREKETEFFLKFFIIVFFYGISGIFCLQNGTACVSEW